jgi:hypothetical protein
MKAISLWQPWASAIALGAKTIETRSWATSYRGPLAIHAAKRRNKEELIYHSCCSDWEAVFHDLLSKSELRRRTLLCLPFGAIVATCYLVDCRPTGSFTNGDLDVPQFPKGTNIIPGHFWTERGMGDFSLGRFGWVLENIKALPEPIPCKGMQGLFEWRGI